MAADQRFEFETGAATDVGRKRQINEDSYLARPGYGLWVVADGMGGHSAGDYASQTIVAELDSVGMATSVEDLRARFMERLTRANDLILQHADRLGAGTIGATVVAILANGDHYACVWSGDSRAYLLRGGQFVQQSRDHTEVQALLDAGTITPHEAETWPRKNVITRAVGVTPTPQCDVVVGALAPGDVFILCSDGLTEHMLDHEIAAAAAHFGPQEACDRLVQETLVRGARDNVTVIAVRCVEADVSSDDDMLIDGAEEY
ncbi:MAG: SpoIIE family protein phosphatase [Pseudomonadota bacterium]|nr:SpoIIE family protein phosphatase [Pseudomonadota bacterium]